MKSNYQQKDNTFTLFLNDNAGNNPKAPTHKGKGLIFGQEVAVAGWKKTSKDGKVYLSCKIEQPWKGGKDSVAEEQDAF